jgi:excisionase family DNA binding protein
MRVREAAQRLDVSQATVYALVASGKLRCHRVGMGRGCIRISEEHLAEYLKASEPVIAPVPPAALARRPKLKHLRR